MEIPDGWNLEKGGKALVRSFTLKDFAAAFAFLTQVAIHAEKVGQAHLLTPILRSA